MKNLILGTATGYTFDKISPFLNSLQKINFKGDVTLIVSDTIDKETKNDLIKNRIQLYFLDHRKLNFANRYAGLRIWKVHYLAQKIIYHFLNRGEDKLERLSRYVQRFHQISGSRFCYYYDYLVANTEKYNNIMLTDVRDVIFQNDPFLNIGTGRQMNFYGEDNYVYNFYTAYWVKQAFGNKEFNKIKDETLFCAGTTIGTTAMVLDYLQKMILTQAAITPQLTGLDGFDQGVHNFLIHKGYFPAACLNLNYEAEVATLSDAGKIALNDKRQVVNKQQVPVPVIHQYNRIPDLKLSALDVD